MTEEWRPVVGYEGAYEVSDQGCVRSLDRVVMREGGLASGRPMQLRGALMKLHPAKAGGYWTVALCQEGRQRTRHVHALVMAAFVGPRPAGMEIRHLDGDSAHCALTNLAYGHPSDNAMDRVRHGTHNMAAKTHFIHGHVFDEANTYQMSTGGRACRTCHNDRAKAKRARDRALRAG